MKEVSQLIVAFFNSQAAFTNIFSNRFYAMAAPGSVTWPFAIFRIYEEAGASKDGDSYQVTLSLHFKPEKYSECLDACDVMKPIIKKEFHWLSSEPEINEEDLSYMGIINFKLNN